MNLRKVDFKRDLKYIQDNGVDKYLMSVVYGERVADAYNPWKESYDSLFEYCDENDVPFKRMCKAVDKSISSDRLREITNKFCDYTDDNPESLDDTVIETVEHGNYSWEQAVDILDVLLSDEEKKSVIAKVQENG